MYVIKTGKYQQHLISEGRSISQHQENEAVAATAGETESLQQTDPPPDLSSSSLATTVANGDDDGGGGVPIEESDPPFLSRVRDLNAFFRMGPGGFSRNPEKFAFLQLQKYLSNIKWVSIHA